jgi:hypothetical protein
LKLHTLDAELALLIGNEDLPVDSKLRRPEYRETVTSASSSFVSPLGYQRRGIGEDIEGTINLVSLTRSSIRRRQPNSFFVKNRMFWAQRAARPL